MTDTTSHSIPLHKDTTVYAVLLAVSFCHFLNDLMQSLLAALYPMIKEGYGLTFWQIGALTLTFQGTASLLQPLIGIYTDKRPMPYSLPVGMASTLAGLILLTYAGNYLVLLVGAAFIGLGSAVFHPESSRVARMASGGRYSLAQSIFQVGGNAGSAVGPLLAAVIVAPRGQQSISWFSLVALLCIVILWRVSVWYARERMTTAKRAPVSKALPFARKKTLIALSVLVVLTFSKNVYMASLSSYYTFYVINKFGVSERHSQFLLFILLGAAAAGTILGGLAGGRFGPRTVIWFSILGALPFTLALPYVDLMWTGILSAIIGMVMASSFPAILVFAQELIPGRVGMIAGIFFGFAFGMGGLGAAALGVIADAKGIDFVYMICSFLPMLGLLTILLPNMKYERRRG